MSLNASGSARQQRSAIRSSAPLPLRPLVPAHPAAEFVVAAVLIAAAILIVAVKPATATLIVGVVMLLGGVWLLAGAIWNEMHHGAVADALGAQRRAQQASLRRHPVLWLTLAPLAAAARAIARLQTGGSHHGIALILAVGLGTWALVIAAVMYGIRRARRDAGPDQA